MDTNTTVNEFFMASNQNMSYANGYIKGMLLDMHKDATSDREGEVIRHCIHVSNLFFLQRNHRDVGEISAGIYKVANRLALGQTLTVEVINGHNSNFALYADDESVMESTDRALLQIIVEYSKNNELCLSLENIS
jgi:hypothetical protein